MSRLDGLVPSPPPRRLSTFVGRRAEIADLRRLLTGTRLLTLVGAGGCGKTRLAIEVAALAGSAFPAGVGFVELAPVQDPSLVPEAVAAALGVPLPASDRLADLIGDARLLLIVDNAEHLVAGVSVLVERLLAACAGLVVMVTSREPLGVDGERSWRVPPMVAPPEGAFVDAAVLAGCDAVRLFCARCAEQRSDFQLTDGNAPLVAAICRRLDGMPLALELAAARVRSFGLTEVLRRLEDTLGLLTRGPRGAVDRQRTLRATLEWSHRLLDETERRLFRRLALFVGTFDLEAVEAICPCRDLPAEQVADVLQRLVDKSLVATHAHREGGLRYSLMEAVRQYALERLEEAADADLRARHARWYAELAARLDDDRELLADRIERMSVEYDNVRRALDWAADGDPGVEAALVVSLRWFWLVRGSIREARPAALAAAARRPAPPEIRAGLHREAANWSYLAGDLETARSHAEEAALLLDRIDHPVIAASVLWVRGVIGAAASREAGERDLERARALLEPTAARELLARVLNDLALLRLVAGRVSEALATVEQIIPMCAALCGRSCQNPQWLHTYGAVLLAAGRVHDARDGFLAGLDEAVRYGNYATAAALLRGLACVASAAGDATLCLELAAAGRRCGQLAGAAAEDPPGIPATAAERTSEAALSRPAAARARELGAELDLRAALRHAQAVRSDTPPAPLTPRKREIVLLVTQGLTNREIARRLTLSERTVEAHLEQVRNQLGLSNRVQIATWAGAHLGHG